MSKTAPELVEKLLGENEKTLLILDNIQDMSVIQDVISLARWKGHLLLSTRFAQSLFPTVLMPPLSLEESTLLLLRRGRIISKQGALQEASEDKRQVATEIAEELGGYPLVLNQAGAHLALSLSLSRYLSLFRRQPIGVLGQQQESRPTLLDVLEETRRHLTPKSQSLLPTLASLPPDSSTWLELDNEVINDLLHVFLIQRNKTTVEMHRLVRMIISGEKKNSA